MGRATGRRSAERTGAMAHLRGQRITQPSGQYNRLPLEWIASPDRILFSGRSADSTNLWEVSLTKDLTLAGPARRLTAGAAYETEAAFTSSAGGRMAFSSLRTELRHLGHSGRAFHRAGDGRSDTTDGGRVVRVLAFHLMGRNAAGVFQSPGGRMEFAYERTGDAG